jgi:hypothetical protein
MIGRQFNIMIQTCNPDMLKFSLLSVRTPFLLLTRSLEGLLDSILLFRFFFSNLNTKPLTCQIFYPVP